MAEKTLRDLAEEAYRVQDACNLCGVAQSYFYTLDGAYIDRERASAALRSGARYWCSQRGETRAYHTVLGKLTVWMWPFRSFANEVQ